MITGVIMDLKLDLYSYGMLIFILKIYYFFISIYKDIFLVIAISIRYKLHKQKAMAYNWLSLRICFVF